MLNRDQMGKEMERLARALVIMAKRCDEHGIYYQADDNDQAAREFYRLRDYALAQAGVSGGQHREGCGQ